MSDGWEALPGGPGMNPLRVGIHGAAVGVYMNVGKTAKWERDEWIAAMDGWRCPHCDGRLRRIPGRSSIGDLTFDFECLDAACFAVHGKNHFVIVPPATEEG